MKKPTHKDKRIAKRWRWALSTSGSSEFITAQRWKLRPSASEARAVVQRTSPLVRTQAIRASLPPPVDGRFVGVIGRAGTSGKLQEAPPESQRQHSRAPCWSPGQAFPPFQGEGSGPALSSTGAS